MVSSRGISEKCTAMCKDTQRGGLSYVRGTQRRLYPGVGFEEGGKGGEVEAEAMFSSFGTTSPYRLFGSRVASAPWPMSYDHKTPIGVFPWPGPISCPLSLGAILSPSSMLFPWHSLNLQPNPLTSQAQVMSPCFYLTECLAWHYWGSPSAPLVSVLGPVLPSTPVLFTPKTRWAHGGPNFVCHFFLLPLLAMPELYA